MITTIDAIARPTIDKPAPRPVVEARGVVLVRDGKTGRPKFDLPMCMYPSWAQAEFWKVLTEAERAEFF